MFLWQRKSVLQHADVVLGFFGYDSKEELHRELQG